jgi:hypothetical protein
VHWFRKARYVAALFAILLSAVGFATQVGEHSTRYVVSVYLLFAGGAVLTVVVAWVDHTTDEWLS